jgi:hypothetical protein
MIKKAFACVLSLFEEDPVLQIDDRDIAGDPEEQGDLDETVLVQYFGGGAGVGVDVDDLQVAHDAGHYEEAGIVEAPGPEA